MKTRWWITACAAALLALTCGAAVAKNQNRGQSKKEYQQFNENQRQFARTYYNQHQQLFAQDRRWNNEYENRLQPGYVLDKDMRGMSRPAPSDLTRGLGAAPRGYRYIVIGGHVVLVDSAYRVHDTIHLHINLH
jgi:Ni/Co efflux regulator RcnB